MSLVLYIRLYRQTLTMHEKAAIITLVVDAIINFDATHIKIIPPQVIDFECQTVARMEWALDLLQQFAAWFMDIKLARGATIASTLNLFETHFALFRILCSQNNQEVMVSEMLDVFCTLMILDERTSASTTNLKIHYKKICNRWQIIYDRFNLYHNSMIDSW